MITPVQRAQPWINRKTTPSPVPQGRKDRDFFGYVDQNGSEVRIGDECRIITREEWANSPLYDR